MLHVLVFSQFKREVLYMHFAPALPALLLCFFFIKQNKIPESLILNIL